MLYTDACIYFIIGILTIGFPLFLTAIGRLDDRYESALITDVFRDEPVWKYFMGFLYSSIGICGLHVLVAFITIGNNSGNIDSHSSGLLITGALLYLATLILIINFIRFVNLILIYFSAQRLINQFKAKTDTKEYLYFRSLADILYVAIKREDESVITTLTSEFSDRFSRFRQSVTSGPVTYPEAYYEFQYKIIRDTLENKSPKIHSIRVSATDGTWLLGSFHHFEISERTYKWLWYNLELMVEYNNDNLILGYWKMADQYMQFGLDQIRVQQVFESGEYSETNRAEVDQRENERSHFLQFHYALGGLLLYRKKYDVIRRVFQYSNSTPPRYELLPESINNIIRNYLKFTSHNDPELWPINAKYPFPDQEGIAAHEEIKEWIASYLALLLLRLYTFSSPYYGVKHVTPPEIPDTQIKKQTYVDNLPYLIKDLEELLGQQELLKILGLDVITPEWCEENNKIYPVILIKEFIARIQAAFKVQEITQPIAAEKVEEFRKSSTEILTNAFAIYGVLQNETSITKDFHENAIRGTSQPMDKSAFAVNQWIHHMNYDTILAKHLSKYISDEVSLSIRSRVSSRYLVRQTDFEGALKKLNIVPGKHAIICFGLDEATLQNHLISAGIQMLAGDVIFMPAEAYSTKVFYRNILILDKDKLPNIEYLQVEPQFISTYNLDTYDEQLHIYGSVIDLHANNGVRERLAHWPTVDLHRSVLLTLQYRMVLRWRNNTVITQLRIYDAYVQQGIPNNVSDIKAIGDDLRARREKIILEFNT